MRHTNPRDEYIAHTFPVEDNYLLRIREALVRDGKDGIQVSAGDARILQFLIRICGVKKICEIGTLYGYSTYAMGLALPEDGQIWTLDSSAAHHQKAKSLIEDSKVSQKIHFITGDAKVNLSEVSQFGPFDLVFIDANKVGYLDYLDWAEANIKKGGLIVGDNTFLFDALFSTSRDPNMGPKQIAIMNEFNRRLSDSSKYNSVLLPTSEGMTVGQMR